ncbi:MAG: host attachment protein [Verrucomicrobiota bacterium]
MNTKFFIITNRGHLLALRRTETNSLELLDETFIKEGNAKLSELVTDQAGAFGNSGTPGTTATERMPLEAELEVQCFRKIAAKISDLLKEHNPGWWGLAAPSEINGAIVDHLDAKVREKISVNLKLDLTNSPRSGLLKRFEKAAHESPR